MCEFPRYSQRVHLTYMMNLQFRLKGTPLEKADAKALLAITQKDTKEPFEIDLEKIIDLQVLDSRKLFELAIQSKTPQLAELAFQVGSTTKRKRGRPPGKTSVSPKKMKSRMNATPEEIVEELHKSSSYWAVGAASIILEAQPNEWLTTREIAIRIANKFSKRNRVPQNSVLFKGFVRDKNQLIPLDFSSKTDRNKTFHVSPIYLGIREGLIWCVKRGLIEQKTDVSVGSRDKTKVTGRGSKVSRVFYKVRATKKATEIVDMWGDLTKYVESFYKTRTV